ncbi:MAG: hypothetical protein ABR512_12915 [Desulfopila sp.]
MQRLKFVSLIVFALMLTGCGQKVDERINLRYEAIDAPGMGRSLVILPFADYTSSNDLASAYRRNLLLNESLIDNLAAQGFAMPVSEDVFRYLVDQGIVKMAGYDDNTNVSLKNELNNDWSGVMKNRIRHYLRQQQISQSSVEGSPGTHALSAKEVAKLGRQFGADYIVRGRLLEYRTRQDATWDPSRRGILPVFFGGTSQALFGFTGADSYDTVNQMVAGGMLGVGIGDVSNWPMDDSRFLAGSNLEDQQAGWGVIGGYLAKRSAKSGNVDQAVVRVRMWVQEASSGQVVWTNSAMVRVAPKTVFSDSQYDDLFSTAIDKGVTSLVDSFVHVAL